VSEATQINVKIFITLFMAVFVTTMGAGLVAPLLPVYAHDLGAGGLQVGLIFGAFSLTRTIFVPYFGKLSDRKGKKPLLTVGLLAYFLTSLLYTAATTIETLILLRLGQGFASAMILPVAQAYVGQITPTHKEGRIMGLFNISLYGGLSAGPVMGGLVKDWLNIQASFLGMGILTFLGFMLCLLFLPPETIPGKNSPSGSQKPISYMKLMKSPSAFSLFAFRACFTTAVGITWAFLPLLADVRLALSSSAIGTVVMINVFTAGLLQVPMGYLADRFSKKALTLSGGILATLAVLYLDRADSFGALILANGIFGLAGGISFPAIMAMGVIEGRRTKAMGSMMGLLAFGHSLGMLAGPVLGGVLLDFFPFGTIFMFGAIVLIAGTAIFWRSN
jgi:DHA1 family multidrug resistance protein-like MFS transporter